MKMYFYLKRRRAFHLSLAGFLDGSDDKGFSAWM